jgi:hypothetical protein
MEHVLKIAAQRRRSWRVGNVRTRVARDGRVVRDWYSDGERITSDRSFWQMAPQTGNACGHPLMPNL